MKKYLKIILAGVVIVAVIVGLIIAWVFITQEKVSDAVANVYQHGKLIRSIDLNEVEDSYTFDIKGDNGAFNTVLVEHGAISIIASSCPDKVCIAQGKIRDGVLPITCLPNQVVIKIESKNSSNGNSSGLDGQTR